MADSINLPVLEPNLNRTLRHVDLLGYPLTDESCGGRVLVELEFQSRQLVLGGALPLLVLLLLGQGALPGRAARGRLGSRAVTSAGRVGGRGGLLAGSSRHRRLNRRHHGGVLVGSRQGRSNRVKGHRLVEISGHGGRLCRVFL